MDAKEILIEYSSLILNEDKSYCEILIERTIASEDGRISFTVNDMIGLINFSLNIKNDIKPKFEKIVNIIDLESKAYELLNSIQSLKLNRQSKERSFITPIDAFYEHLGELDDFLKLMRPKGYFGKSPQEQIDLDKQQEMIKKLREIREFVELNYKKNIDLVNQ
jgi:hypothetical protein